MKTLRLKSVFVLVMMGLLSGGSVVAQEVYEVYTNYIPGLLTEELTGPFVEMTKEIGRRAHLQLVLKIVPPQRLRTLFKEKQFDIIFPMLPSSFDQETQYYRSSAFYVKRDFVFTRKGMPLVKTMSDLENMKGSIGLTHGYSYPEALLSNPKLTFDYAPSDDQNLLKLAAGRIVAFIVEENSGVQAAKKLKLEDKIHYDPTTLFTEDVFYAFQKEERLLKVRDAISRAIEDMQKDGTLQKIFAGPAAAEKETK